VLSFSGEIHMRTKMKTLSSIINKITKSLQVPCSPLFYTSKSYLPGKRVLPFTSHEDMKRKFDGSITVEAALVLPLFVFFGLAVLVPMRWLDTQRQIQTISERFGEDLSQYAYIIESGNQLSESDQQQGPCFSDAAAGLWLYGRVQPYADSVRIIKSEVPDEQGNIWLEVKYQEKIPFFPEIIRGATMYVAVKRRGWIGLGGKLTCQMEREVGGNLEQQMVYVTPDGTRYHRYRDCYHLMNVCKAVSIQEVDHLRNKDGKIYYTCSLCAQGQNIKNTVYITTWGTRFHNDRSCAAMSTYFRKVPLIDVIEWGECSDCARRNDKS